MVISHSYVSLPEGREGIVWATKNIRDNVDMYYNVYTICSWLSCPCCLCAELTWKLPAHIRIGPLTSWVRNWWMVQMCWCVPSYLGHWEAAGFDHHSRETLVNVWLPCYHAIRFFRANNDQQFWVVDHKRWPKNGLALAQMVDAKVDVVVAHLLV